MSMSFRFYCSRLLYISAGHAAVSNKCFTFYVCKMDAEYGCSKRGKRTLIYRNYEYIRDTDNACGTTSWRCCKYKSLKYKARVITSGKRYSTRILFLIVIKVTMDFSCEYIFIIIA